MVLFQVREFIIQELCFGRVWRARGVFCVAVIATFVIASSPFVASAERDFGNHYGYVQTVEEERQSTMTELPLLTAPALVGSNFHERIFNEKLIREFRDRYEEKFGRTEVERSFNAPNRFTYYNDLYGFRGTPEEAADAQRQYGGFVFRRLIEYHVDNYAKNDPKLRPAWEAKERLKEFKVELAQFRFDAQYSIAGNQLDIRLVNPYFPLTRVRLQMDPGRIGPAPVDETSLALGRPLIEKVFVEAHYRMMDGTVTFIERKPFTPSLSGSLTQSTFTKPVGVSVRESKYLAGVSYQF